MNRTMRPILQHTQRHRRNAGGRARDDVFAWGYTKSHARPSVQNQDSDDMIAPFDDGRRDMRR